MNQRIKASGIALTFIMALILTIRSLPTDVAGKESRLADEIGSYFSPSLQLPFQCPDAPFAVPAEYVHASYWETRFPPGYSSAHVGIDFTGLTTDPSKARTPPVCSPGSGVEELDVPGEAPVYAAYDGVVWGSHVVNGAWVGIYIKHENVPVNGEVEPVVCTYYEHMGNASTGESTIFAKFRSWGASVKKGEQIGWMGNAGAPFTHLHFGVRPSLYNGGCNPGSNPDPLDPYWWTDPSPYLGFNVDYDNGASSFCYHVGCPPNSRCCCNSTSSLNSFAPPFAPVIFPLPNASFTPSPVPESVIIPQLAVAPAVTPLPTVAPFLTYQQTILQLNTELPASAHYKLERSVLGIGGGPKASARYIMQGTSGQTTGVDNRQSNSYLLQSGYWGEYWGEIIALRSDVYLPVILKQR